MNNWKSSHIIEIVILLAFFGWLFYEIGHEAGYNKGLNAGYQKANELNKAEFEASSNPIPCSENPDQFECL